ncbi:MAG: T9SS type A sorting domain-containing protein [Bacteroidota bacterium]
MKNHSGFSALILLFCCLATVVNAQQNTFAKVYYDISGATQANALVRTFDQNYLVAGSKDNVASVMKVDMSGNIVWTRKYGTASGSHFGCIIPTYQLNFMTAGTTTIPGTGGNNNIFCAEINHAGDTLWTRVIDMGQTVTVFSAQETSDHGFILAGYLGGGALPASHILVVKLDLNGYLQWSSILDSGNENNFGYSVKETTDSGYIVSGEIENYPPYSRNACLIKLTHTGAVSWSKKIVGPSPFYSSGWDVIVTTGGFIFYLYTSPPGAAIIKTDLSGNYQWGKFYNSYSGGANYGAQLPRLHTTYDNGYVFMSSMSGFDQMIKTDSAANLQWGQTFQLVASDVIPAFGPGYMVLGNGPIMGVKSPTLNPQVALIRTDSAGNTTACSFAASISPGSGTVTLVLATFAATTGGSHVTMHPALSGAALSVFEGCVPVLAGVAETSPGDELFGVSPNPSGGIFQIINLHPERHTLLHAEIVNAMGVTVYRSPAGFSNQITADLSSLPDGICFARVTFNDGTATRKILLQH